MILSTQDGDNFIRNACTVFTSSGRRQDFGRLRKTDAYGEIPIAMERLLVDLSIDDEDFESTVDMLCRAACEYIERRTAMIALQSEYEWRADQWWNGKVEIRRTPLRDFIALEYLADDAADGNDWTVVPASEYWIVDRADSFTVSLLNTFENPSLWQLHDCVRARFHGGYDSDYDSGSAEGVKPLPPAMRAMVTMVTAHYFSHRDLFSADRAADVELSAGSLLGAYATIW
jgi:uncharacterized phiE125 gp8 family phage protein